MYIISEFMYILRNARPERSWLLRLE